MAYLRLLLALLTFCPPIHSVSVPIDRTGWTITADSQETGHEIAKAIDGNPNTFWHSRWSPAPAKAVPNIVTIDMKNSFTVTGVSIQPRQDGRGNGRIGDHHIHVSQDGTNWGNPVVIGNYLNDMSTKVSSFLGRPARYVRITALSEAGSPTNPWSSIAEINVLGDFNYKARSGWSVSADNEERTAAQMPATNAIDGQGGTLWHTQYGAQGAKHPHWFRIDQGSSQTVSGLVYTPRVGPNGRIGQWRVESSTDGSTWTQRAAGTWADTGDEKFAHFTITARYIRLVALTEAGNRGPWTSAAEINLVDPTPNSHVTPSPSKGLWTHTIDMPIIPVAAANLPDGKVLVWSAFKLDDYVGGTGLTQTAIFDPATGITTRRIVTDNQHDMFCPGISFDFQGRIVVTGGNDEQKTTIFNPASNAWIPSQDMVIPRGYQSTTTCSDGRIFAIGGSWSGARGGKNGEIYDPATNKWSLIKNALVAPMATEDRGGMYRADNHAWLFGWKNKYVFQAGPSKRMNWYNVDGDGSVTDAGLRANDIDAMNGNAVMYDAVEGRILTMGGAPNYQGSASTANAFNMTLAHPPAKPHVVRTQNMAFQRGFANAVVLPDGSVMVTGGQAWVEPFTDTTSAQVPELWSPSTGRWTQLSEMGVPRTYHSIALLLPDATVLNGGGGLCGGCPTNHWDAEIFVPPYLLNSDGSRKQRPTINTVATTVKLGATLSITTGGSVSSFALIRHGAVTHSVNTDQRRIPLKPTGSGGSFTVTIPSDPGVALPGYWFLFALDSAGTPSIAKTIAVTV